VRTIKLNNFSRELEDFTHLNIEQTKRGIASGVAKSIPMLVAASPIDQGFYAQSWDMTVTETEVILGNYAPYASIIEEGARPFTPPIAPLLAWAKRVLQDSSQPPQYSERVRSLAYGVRKKIQAQGIKPKKVLENALPAIIENIRKELERA
jgi:hypothetical protein